MLWGRKLTLAGERSDSDDINHVSTNHSERRELAGLLKPTVSVLLAFFPAALRRRLLDSTSPRFRRKPHGMANRPLLRLQTRKTAACTRTNDHHLTLQHRSPSKPTLRTPGPRVRPAAPAPAATRVLCCIVVLYCTGSKETRAMLYDCLFWICTERSSNEIECTHLGTFYRRDCNTKRGERSRPAAGSNDYT